jgi:hypothetical protein
VKNTKKEGCWRAWGALRRNVCGKRSRVFFFEKNQKKHHNGGLPFESVGVYKVRSVDSKNPIEFPCKFW